jgi:hypothetical protein
MWKTGATAAGGTALCYCAAATAAGEHAFSFSWP